MPKQYPVIAVDTHPRDQWAEVDGCRWNVQRLHSLAADLPVYEIPLVVIDLRWGGGEMSLRELAGHVQAVNDADLSYPTILDENGCLMDGRHRLTKAILEGLPTIKAVRLEENPSPCADDSNH